MIDQKNNINSTYNIYDGTDFKYIKEHMENFYTMSYNANKTWQYEAHIDTRFEAGDQAIWGQVYPNVPSIQRPTFNFNKTKRIINLISGYQRKNRKSIVAVPVENADDEVADQLTQVLLWLNRTESVLETISEAFQGALITGMNLLHVWIDYRKDPISGNIRVDNAHYNSFIIDPYFRKTDLSDCNGIWKRTYLSREEAMSLLPEKADEIAVMPVNSQYGSDGKFPWMAENFDVNFNNLLTYDEFYYRTLRKQTLIVDTKTGETQEWNADLGDKNKVIALEQFLGKYKDLKKIETSVPTVRVAIALQGNIVYDMPNPTGDEYPFIPVVAYYNPQEPYFETRLQGVCRSMRAPQFLYNRRMNIVMSIMERTRNTGYIYKEDALVDPSDVFDTQDGKGIAIKKHATIADIQRINPIDIPAAFFQINEILDKDIVEITGANQELMGADDDNKPGILSMLRQGAGLTTLQVLFDHLDHSQKILGKRLINIIQQCFTPGKIQRILGKPVAQEFYDKTFGIYDAAIEDGLLTATQRQMQFAQLMYLREAGIPISNEDLLKASTLQNKKEIIENMSKQAQQQAQMAQQQMQMQQQQMAVQMQVAQARAKADLGLAAERDSRVLENQMSAYERVHEANKEDAQALLDKIKAVKELESMDLSHLQQLIGIANTIKQQEHTQAEQQVKSQLGVE